ncbi:hypothetical protein KJ657_04645 [Patescibacteria group bacterium]|nr:hypothetical protein [Patescibacteria group bacterium]MBU1016343.1 hypothetical protein [Patescibacteria group bacterium]MBU1685046.1 hypothetical protein [Patescibacteria group bacterium]MBU1938854.1 hypothetical protein [Patescibacteria group bacterium]
MKNKILSIAFITGTLFLAGCKTVDKLPGPPSLPARVIPPTTNTTIPTSVQVVGSVLTESEAKQIAESECIKGGETLESGFYNENSKTWWFDANLNTVKEGCNPACVVSEDGSTEINWRCTGLRLDE